MKIKTKLISSSKGFTLIELILVIILVSVFSAVAIPAFTDFKTDAKNASLKGILGAMRSAVNIAVVAIALKEDPTLSPHKYPNYREFYTNTFQANYNYFGSVNNWPYIKGGTHNNLSGTAIMSTISRSVSHTTDCFLNYGAGNCGNEEYIQDNPWCHSVIVSTAASRCNFMRDCTDLARGAKPFNDYWDGAVWHSSGWCYNQTNGGLWAHSLENGGTNNEQATNRTENWY